VGSVVVNIVLELNILEWHIFIFFSFYIIFKYLLALFFVGDYIIE
jgi:hypothetical protein